MAPEHLFIGYEPGAASIDQLVANIVNAVTGGDQALVMHALVRVLIQTYSLIDAAGDERHLVQLRNVLGRFHENVENNLVGRALARANPAALAREPDDLLPGEAPLTRIH